MEATPQDVERIEAEARVAIGAAEGLPALGEARARFLGRKGSLSAILRTLGSLEPEARARLGEAVNTQTIYCCPDNRNGRLSPVYRELPTLY